MFLKPHLRFVKNAIAVYTIVFSIFVTASFSVSAAENTNLNNSGKTVQLKQNFQNADIRTVIDAVAKLTGKNFIIDPRVKGKVTLIAPEPMPADALYETLLSILHVNNYVAIQGPTAIRIIPGSLVREQADFESKTSNKSSNSDKWVTEVLPVKHTSALKLVPILRPLVAREGHLVALESSNRLIITDTISNIKRIKLILKSADVDSSLGFDIIQIKNGSAEDIIHTIKGVLPKSSSGKQVKMDFDERTNRIILSGDAQQRLEIKALIRELDTPIKSSEGTAVFYLHHANAKEIVPILQKLALNRSLIDNANSKEKGGKTPPAPNVIDNKSLKNKISIAADERTNAVIISAPPQITYALRNVIKHLDIRRAQVLIEAILVEVTQAKQAELGVDWAANGPNGVGLINFSGTLPSIVANTGNPAAQANAVGLGASAVVGQISTDYKGWGALVRALNSDNDANVLATPSLLTLDNQEAEIVVGKEVPFRTGSYTTNSSGSTNPFTTVERKEVGLKLKVKPQINEGNEVNLSIDQEVSSVLPADGAVDLQTSKRQIKTNIVVGDGKMIVLGGLLNERETQVTSKIPGLGDLPLIGGLFRSKQNQREKVNLMIFLRTVIVKNNAISDYYSQKKYRGMQQEQKVLLKKDDRLLDGLRPKLPPLNKWQNPAPKSLEKDQNKTSATKSKQPSPPANDDDADILGF